MATYNTNSVFSVSAGVMPNTTDNLIFFEDISYDQKVIWDEFESLIAVGDYTAAQNLAKSYENLHGYFADLYNMMVNRLKAVQTFLKTNESRINNGTAPFQEFVKPKLARYQSTPTGITQDMVWIGPKGYFDDGSGSQSGPSINLLKITITNSTINGVTATADSDGYVTLNGTSTLQGNLILGNVQNTSLITSKDVWTYYSYYVSGRVENRTSGVFQFSYVKTDGNTQPINISTATTTNLHSNLIGIKNGSAVQIMLKTGYGEVYEDLKVGFMICKASDTSPNQKYVPFRG